MIRFSILLAAAVLLPLRSRAEAPSGPRGDLAFESGEFMKKTFYADSRRAAPQLSDDGAYSEVNRSWEKSLTGSWYIEQQRYGEDAVAAGIAQSDPAAIERGLKILEWGFKQERADGSFDCPDAFHSTSFFVEASAHAALLLEASPYAETYRERLKAWKPKLRATAAWMTRPDVEKKGKARNRPYTHRFYLVAAALGEAGVFLDDSALIGKSKSYVLEGLARQDPSGFNPEKGGHDTSYHTVGLMFASRYYVIVADPALREKMTPMLDRGFRWFETRVSGDGIISSDGNTRTGSGQEAGRDGKPKKLSYNSAYRALAYESMISGDPSFEELAWKIYRAEKRSNRPQTDAVAAGWRVDTAMKFHLAYVPDAAETPAGKTERPENLGLTKDYAPDIDNINLAAILGLGFPLPKKEPANDYKLYLKLFQFPRTWTARASSWPILKGFGVDLLPRTKEIFDFASKPQNLAVKMGLIDKADRRFTAEAPFPPFVAETSSSGQRRFDERVLFSSLYLVPQESKNEFPDEAERAAFSAGGVRSFYGRLIAAYRRNFRALAGDEPDKYEYFEDDSCPDVGNGNCVAVLKIAKAPLIFANWRDLPMPQDPERIFLTGLILVYRTQKSPRSGPLPAQSVLEVGSVVRLP